MANKFKENKTGTEKDSIFKGNWAIKKLSPKTLSQPHKKAKNT